MSVEPLKVTENVYWVGVNDTETKLFEGLWDIPQGISYNSYLAVGSERAALIDSVHSRNEEEHIARIKRIIDPSKIEYIITNHMEPDHTGALPRVLELLPKATVVQTPMAQSMLKAFYNIEPQTMIVKGDDVQIDLGGKTLRFIQTPFLHWPETMSTYLVEDKILFSCDCFGSFKRLPEGAIMETDVQNIDEYMHDASKEYFAGVFSRYRDYVLKAIEKFKQLGIEVEVLASSHGIVYTKNAQKIMDLWASWSKPNYKKKVVVAVGTMYGTNLKFVKAVVEGIEQGGGEAVIRNVVEDAPGEVLEAVVDSPAVIFGGPTYEYDVFPPIGYLLDLLETKRLTDRFVGVFGNFAWSGGGAERLTQRLNTLGFKLVDKPVIVRGSPLPEDLEKVKLLAKAVAETAFKERGL